MTSTLLFPATDQHSDVSHKVSNSGTCTVATTTTCTQTSKPETSAKALQTEKRTQKKVKNLNFN